MALVLRPCYTRVTWSSVSVIQVCFSLQFEEESRSRQHFCFNTLFLLPTFPVWSWTCGSVVRPCRTSIIFLSAPVWASSSLSPTWHGRSSSSASFTWLSCATSATSATRRASSSLWCSPPTPSRVWRWSGLPHSTGAALWPPAEEGLQA